MMFDWTISVGNVLSALAALAAVGAAYLAQRERLARMEVKIDTVWHWWLKKYKLNGNGDSE